MKRILFALLIIALLPLPGFCWSLICDPQAGVVKYDIEVNGNIIAADYPAEADGSISYNVDHLGPGLVRFRLRAYDSSGWGSDWSDPFDASKPGVVGGAKIVRDVTN